MFKLKSKNKNKQKDLKAASTNLIISEQQIHNQVPVADKKVNLESNTSEVEVRKPAKKGELQILLCGDLMYY